VGSRSATPVARETNRAKPIDGRIARSERTRSLVVDALLALIEEEDDLRPTAPRIARRAGVSVRIVYHHFRDLEALLATAALRHLDRVVPTVRPVSPDGPLDARLRAFVAERTRLLERIAKVRRAALLAEPLSPALCHAIREGRKWKRDDTLRVFAKEIGAEPKTTRATLTAALVAASSFSAWDALRNHQELDLLHATAALERTLAALLTNKENA
jgi:AcrR family transcriptional regulator